MLHCHVFFLESIRLWRELLLHVFLSITFTLDPDPLGPKWLWNRIPFILMALDPDLVGLNGSGSGSPEF